MSWRIVRLGDLIENFSVRAKDYGGSEGLEFCGVSNEEGIIKTKYAAEDKAEDYKIIEKGCFAYNPYRVNVGSIGLVTDDFKGLISPAYVVFKPKPNTIIPELLFKFLKSDEGLRQIRFYGRGTVRQALRFEDLCNIVLSIPEYTEQEKLFKKLINSQEKSNNLSTELTHQLELVKKLRQQFLQDAVQGRFDFAQRPAGEETGAELLKKIKAEKQKLIAVGKLKKEKELPPIKTEEIPFNIPEGWVWCRLGEICTKITDGFHNTPPKVPDGYPYIAATQVKSDKIDWDNCSYVDEKYHRELYVKAFPQKGELLVVNIGAGCGTPAIIDVCFEFSFKNTAILKFNQSLISNKLLFYYFLSSKKQIYAELTKGGLQPFLSLKILNEIEFPLPPYEEQTRIVKKLDELMQTCDAIEASIKESSAQNEKLLQQVLREALRKEEVGI
jgi:type I restriction enzyme S subunit